MFGFKVSIWNAMEKTYVKAFRRIWLGKIDFAREIFKKKIPEISSIQNIIAIITQNMLAILFATELSKRNSADTLQM